MRHCSIELDENPDDLADAHCGKGENATRDFPPGISDIAPVADRQYCP
jgi:hypothetical protein